MIESSPILIGGPLCGSKVAPGDLVDTLHTDTGNYLKLEALPNWMVNVPETRPLRPVYIWEALYHDVEGKPAA